MKSTVARTMNLVTGMTLTGNHLGGWRHPQAWHPTAMSFARYVELAQTAERGKFDMLFLADGNGVRMDNQVLFEANAPADRPTAFEPVTLLSALAQHTTHIGLLATATTTYEEPYLLARKFASLDHLSAGRACWNIVTGSNPGDSVNFGRAEHVPRADRYARAEEFVEVVKGLWDSWAPDAFIEDVASHRYLDGNLVHTLDHVGKYLSVQGPLNCARMPQGYPVLFLAGQSDPGRALAAKHADCVFSVAGDLTIARGFYADMKSRLDEFGRGRDSLRILPGATVYVARSQAEADEFYQELQELISPGVGVAYLSKAIGVDLTDYPLDDPLPEITGDVVGVSGFRDNVAAIAAQENLTIRQTYQRILPSMGHAVFVGTPASVADEMEEWFRTDACDGFNVGAPVQPAGLTAIVDLLIPELQRRGLFRTEYRGSTLRERMGLDTPRNPYF